MQYRDFGNLGWKVSALGFGCMRLPTKDGTPGSAEIDGGEAIRMIRHAIDQGVNYVDTAYPYHGGKSEVLLGKALRDGYRDRVKVATKSPVWLIQKADDFDKYLDEQLKRLDLGYTDFYLFHGLNRQRWNDTVLKFDLLERAKAAVHDGRIKHLGFSFHDGYDAFRDIIDGFPDWSFCQIQYNFLDTENQAGTKGLEYAASKGLAVVVMEPLLGGKLANPPKVIREIYDGSRFTGTPADIALRWVWSHPGVSVVLSGMSTFGQVSENLASADRSASKSLKLSDLDLIARLQHEYIKRIPVPCTRCAYCMPCPNGVDIPANLGLYNDGYIHDDIVRSRSIYAKFIKEPARASACEECGECEKKCPQKIGIASLMPKVHAVLGEGKTYS